MDWRIRRYKKEDREMVRHICCETAFMGTPIDKIFRDREVFADFFTNYYLMFEPDNCLVAEVDGKVVGYLTGGLRYWFYLFAQAFILLFMIAPKVVLKIITFQYDRQSLRFIRWAVFRSLMETPSMPFKTAHFHINILPEWRKGNISRLMIFPFLDSIPKKGIKRVCGQIQTYEDRRSVKLFERYGFSLFDQKRLTKFMPVTDKVVFVSTFVKDL